MWTELQVWDYAVRCWENWRNHTSPTINLNYAEACKMCIIYGLANPYQVAKGE